MNLSGFKASWLRAVKETTGKNAVIAALVLINAIAVIGWVRTERTIVLVPPMHDEALEVSASRASSPYKKAWALAVAELTGNITPGNADFVLKSLGELFSPAAYRDISAELAAQINDIKRDSLTVSFEPRQVLYEPPTQKVFVTGQFASQGASGAPIAVIRTYEMKVDIRFGRPWITAFKPYQGQPATADNIHQRVARADATAF